MRSKPVALYVNESHKTFYCPINGFEPRKFIELHFATGLERAVALGRAEQGNRAGWRRDTLSFFAHGGREARGEREAGQRKEEEEEGAEAGMGGAEREEQQLSSHAWTGLQFVWVCLLPMPA